MLKPHMKHMCLPSDDQYVHVFHCVLLVPCLNSLINIARTMGHDVIPTYGGYGTMVTLKMIPAPRAKHIIGGYIKIVSHSDFVGYETHIMFGGYPLTSPKIPKNQNIHMTYPWGNYVATSLSSRALGMMVSRDDYPQTTLFQ